MVASEIESLYSLKKKPLFAMIIKTPINKRCLYFCNYVKTIYVRIEDFLLKRPWLSAKTTPLPKKPPNRNQYIPPQIFGLEIKSINKTSVNRKYIFL